MAATNFKTENNTFRKLIGNGLTYRIPRFQRDYSWTEEEWEDLWLDLMGTFAPGGESAHYMGYLVLQSDDDKTFDVIDGQQRLTTVSLIVLAVLKNLQRLMAAGKDPDANRRIDQIRQTYVGYLDPVTLVARPKLTLNRNNNRYYQDYLVPLANLPRRGFRSSEHLLRKAFEYYDRRVTQFLEGSEGGAPGERLAKLVEDMSDRLFFTVITVTDELNAYKVFETLNARGVRLSATDLLKNYLFSVLARSEQNEHELRNLEERWELMVGRLQSEEFPDFLRIHWNSRRSLTRQAELFETIRGNVTTRGLAFQLLREMEADLETYLSLCSPEPSDWSQAEKLYASILRTFNVRQPFPLLLAAKRLLTAAEFTDLMQTCVVISLRFNVICGYSPADQERAYNSVAQGLATGAIRTLAAALPGLAAIYPSDPVFQEAFAEKSIRTVQSRNNRVVRYILCEIERQCSGQDLSFTSDSFSIEHVLPQSPESGWDSFTDEEADALTYRLGNMTLLNSAENRELCNAAYEAKRPIYARSRFDITKKLATDHAAWTPAHLAAHQRWMAKQATSIWRVAQLG